MRTDFASRIAASRRSIVKDLPLGKRKSEAEGGCGVLGVASTTQIEGRYLLPPLVQMRNRGNGKGGGVALVGLSSTQLGVSRRLLNNDYILQVAYLDKEIRPKVEEKCIHPFFEVHDDYPVASEDDFHSVGLQVKPPSVHRYFVRASESRLEDFIKANGLADFEHNMIEDEFVYQRTFQLNKIFYASDSQKAFVLSGGKNMIVFKLVGYGDEVIKYYKLEDVKAHIWIGHHRYPTKGKVWHPGGAHPFVGLHHSLVHNGDFSNYTAIANHLAQMNMYPLFSTDTEVAALLFDLYCRQYRYSNEILLEAMAPTTERDFHLLPLEKRKLYRRIQISHIQASPDGPWFFVVAGHDPYTKSYDLYGITDTSMLRPHVFAVQDGDVKIGIIASERQVINALLRELRKDRRIPCSYADKYWSARGGSHVDGGAYIFRIGYSNGLKATFKDKFGREVRIPGGRYLSHIRGSQIKKSMTSKLEEMLSCLKEKNDLPASAEFFRHFSRNVRDLDYDEIVIILDRLIDLASEGGDPKVFAIDVLTMMHDLNYDPGEKKRASLNELFMDYINSILGLSLKSDVGKEDFIQLVDYDSRKNLQSPADNNRILAVNSLDFPQQGDDGLSRFLVHAFEKGWRRFIVFNLRGHRFIGCGFGPHSEGIRIDAYGDIGDYAGSGMDGLEFLVHGPGQDQALQIAKAGKAVFYGDVGQTFMYGAKGGEVYVMGNAAGRPIINAVGHPRVVINGTCLDYLAESFMAGDPLKGGGYVIVNGIEFDYRGRLVEQPEPYPGGNLLSLASGGAVYLRDPRQTINESQLHGGEIKELTQEDWKIVERMLYENSKLFGISISDLLTVNGKRRRPEEVYRKISPVRGGIRN